jgi:hypothetical protein
MSNHTQGWWYLSVNKSWKTNPFSIVVRKDGVHRTTIANLPARKTIGPEEREATARLLTAAPDLLEALIKTAALLHPDLPEHKAARAAIAKALGEKG